MVYGFQKTDLFLSLDNTKIKDMSITTFNYDLETFFKSLDYILDSCSDVFFIKEFRLMF